MCGEVVETVLGKMRDETMDAVVCEVKDEMEGEDREVEDDVIGEVIDEVIDEVKDEVRDEVIRDVGCCVLLELQFCIEGWKEMVLFLVELG